MANVFDVANFFIDITNNSEEDVMTNLKLNKLLYFAQGYYYVRTKKQLFKNNIEAWQYGPVISDIYHKYKVCGRNPIPKTDSDYSESCFNDDELETLIDVAREYGKYSSSYLVDLTHQEDGVWKKFFKDNCNNTIPLEEIGKYFEKKYDIKLHSFNTSFNTSNIKYIGYHDNNNILVLPKDEDDEDDDWSEYNEC